MITMIDPTPERKTIIHMNVHNTKCKINLVEPALLYFPEVRGKEETESGLHSSVIISYCRKNHVHKPVLKQNFKPFHHHRDQKSCKCRIYMYLSVIFGNHKILRRIESLFFF